jgi:hypothetical protein
VGQQDRLARLRARLQSSSSSSSSSKESAPREDDLLADGGSEQPADGAVDAAPEPVHSGRETLPLDDAANQQDDGEHSGLFDDVEISDPSAPEARLPDSGQPDSDEADVDQSELDQQESDRIPFIGGAPELQSDSKKVGGKKESEGITGSLLIQLDSIQKEGRGKKAMLIVAALLIIGGLVAVAIHLAGQVEPEEPVVQNDSSKDEDDGELVQRTYSEEERSKVLVLGSQRVGEDEGKEAVAEPVEKDDKPVEVAAKQEKAPKKERVRGPQIKDDSAAMDKAFESATKKGARDEGLKKTIDDGAVAKTQLDSPMAGKSDAFKGLSALDSSRDDPIYNPTDSLKDREKSTAGGSKLNRKQIAQGMRTVRRSIGICRQRHTRRGTPLDARKIYLTITLQPSGSISNVDLDPERIRNTEFERCMTSHRARWKFPSFDGESQKMRAPFVLE